MGESWEQIVRCAFCGKESRAEDAYLENWLSEWWLDEKTEGFDSVCTDCAFANLRHDVQLNKTILEEGRIPPTRPEKK